MGLGELLKKHGFTFNKRYGQNFISDKGLLDTITQKSGVDKNTAVLEIGCGAGTLTRSLCNAGKFVYGWEIDKNLAPILRENLSECVNCKIVFKDVMREKTADIERMIGSEYMLVANLPYYITSPIIMKFIEQSEKCTAIVVMVQQEVAARICAQPGSSEYGAITAGIAVTADSEILLDVSRNMFMPMPNVDSAVVKITFNRNKFEGVDRKAYRDTVRIAFSSRRKTLANNLKDGLKITKEQAESLLEKCNVDKMARGETLSAEQFVNLSKQIAQMQFFSNKK